jgi:hypothetical protein
MKIRSKVLAALLSLAACGLSAQAPAATAAQPMAPKAGQPDPWATLRFLFGTWEGKTTGGVAQAQAPASYSFRLELRDHIVARHTSIGACSSPDDLECRHSDLLYIYPGAGGGSFQAIYFDNEGHVIRYDVSVPTVGTALFVSSPGQPGPQYRLTYTLVEDAMTGKFEIRMAGQGDFMSYLEWSGKRQ